MTMAKRILLFLCFITAFFVINNWARSSLSHNETFRNGATLLMIILVIVIDRFTQSSLNRILYTKCDPETYIKRLRRILNGIVEKRSPARANVRRLELCNGLFAAGRYDEMETELQKITVFPERTAALCRFYYLQLHFHNHIRKHELQYAADLLDTLRAKPLVTRLKPAMTASMKQGLTGMSYALRMAQGNDEGAEEYYLGFMHGDTYSRVTAQLHLGRICQRRGETDKARTAYQYVVTYGNKLHIVRLAADALATLDSASPSV